MKLIAIEDAQNNLASLVRDAREEAIGLTDEAGNLVGILRGVHEDDLDELLVQTPEFRAMMARSLASIETEGTIPLEELMEELRSELAGEPAEGQLNSERPSR
jgi:hypothetical protein